jgi:hypothetical protein
VADKTEYAVSYVRDGETFIVPTPTKKQAGETADAYAYDRDNGDVKIISRTVTDWAEES